MHKIIIKILIFVFIISNIFIACSEDEEVTPVKADFTVTVTGVSPEADLDITNNSTGAASYEWTFSEGASIETSTQETPVVVVDKAGEMVITLLVKNGSEEDELTKTITIPGYSAIITYSDLEFDLHSGIDVNGRLFSFETGQMYRDSEINTDNGSEIHLGFKSLQNTVYYFESPDSEEFNIPGATSTRIDNFESPAIISVEDFDNMPDDKLLTDLTIEHTDESFGNESIPGTVLFEISSGQKGVIKTREVNTERILVDIKIQKY